MCDNLVVDGDGDDVVGSVIEANGYCTHIIINYTYNCHRYLVIEETMNVVYVFC